MDIVGEFVYGDWWFFHIYVFVSFGVALVISTFQAPLFATKDSNAPRVYAPSWMQRPMEAVRYMPTVAQPSVPPQAVTQLQLPQGWVKSRHIIHGRYVYKAYTLAYVSWKTYASCSNKHICLAWMIWNVVDNVERLCC